MRYAHVLGATDFSALGDLAIQRAVEIAHDQGARLTLVHVLPQPTSPSPLVAHYYEVRTDDEKLATAKLEAAAALRDRVRPELRDSDAIDVAFEVCWGDPCDEILALESRIHPDLIVLATHGRRGLAHWIMGSVTERVLRGANADVLAVRAREGE